MATSITKGGLAIIAGGVVLGAMLFAGTVGALQLMSVISLAPLAFAGALIAAAAVGAGDGFPVGYAAILAADKCIEKWKGDPYKSV